MLGNEAIARGAVEAGISFVTAYPGTPSTEILETLAGAAQKYGYKVEWAVNEKVAFEAAIAFSLTGLRSLVCMKHVGMNWICDPLLAVNLGGIKGGLVILSADDPGARSSHNEQDTRYYGFLAEIPIFEPSGPAEARDMIKNAFDISEKLQLPVIVRSVSRVSHVRETVTIGELPEIFNHSPEFKRDTRFVVTGAGGKALKYHQQLHEKLKDIGDIAEQISFNYLNVPEKSEIGIITTGVASSYVLEALKALESYRDKIAIFRSGMCFPLPVEHIIKLSSSIERLLVVEEGEPVVELQVKDILMNNNLARMIDGKRNGTIPPTGELTTEVVLAAICQVLDIPQSSLVEREKPQLPVRALTMCTGCPHRATFYALKKVVNKIGRDNCIMCGDIGCYSFASQLPFDLVDVKYTMGASIGTFSGFCSTGINKKVITVIGDSTFYHAGIPALLNAVYNEAEGIIIIVDNATTAMTGQQPHVGTGKNGMGEKIRPVQIEKVLEGIGISFVKIVDSYDVLSLQQVLEEAAGYKGLAVVISRRECALLAGKSKKDKNNYYEVDTDKCIGCKICIKQLACPAIIMVGDKAEIIKHECTGCGVCAIVCPQKVIVKAEVSY